LLQRKAGDLSLNGLSLKLNRLFDSVIIKREEKLLCQVILMGGIII